MSISPETAAHSPEAAPSAGPATIRHGEGTPYLDLDRAAWSALRERTPLPLSAREVEQLRGLGERIDVDEVREMYLPISRLLNLYVGAVRGLRSALETFLRGDGDHAAEEEAVRTPFVIGIAGSVAVGKSTTARLLRELLARWPEHPRVELVTTDGFLLPNAELERRGLLARKGFPESYDRRALTRFVADVKSGRPEVTAPVYSHLVYDIVPGQVMTVRRPDILIVEGLNVLQPAAAGGDGRIRMGLADYFDFSIYVDARTDDIERWYLDRFSQLRATAFTDPDSYFRRFAAIPEHEAREQARGFWQRINLPNLVENVLPTRRRATLVLRKGANHDIERVWLRKL